MKKATGYRGAQARMRDAVGNLQRPINSLGSIKYAGRALAAGMEMQAFHMDSLRRSARDYLEGARQEAKRARSFFWAAWSLPALALVWELGRWLLKQ